jgi:hypothetical protein
MRVNHQIDQTVTAKVDYQIQSQDRTPVHVPDDRLLEIAQYLTFAGAPAITNEVASMARELIGLRVKVMRVR